MVECWLPYGKTEVHLSVPLEDLLGVAEPDTGQSTPISEELIHNSINNPIGSRPLSEIVKPGASVAIALDGIVNFQPVSEIIPFLVDKFGHADVSMGDITIIIGNGTREKSNPELLQAFEELEVLKDCTLIEHTRESINLNSLGTTSMGTKIEVNDSFSSADIRIAIGEVLLDAFTGFRGAHSAILPAISGMSTIETNRIRAFDENATQGSVEKNPVLNDVLEAASLTKVDYAINLVVTPHGRLMKVYSGGIEESWKQAISELADSYKVSVDANADIIVVSAGGRKFDYDLYNSIWALHSALQLAKKGSTIILLAECSEGLGAEGLSKLSQIDRMTELRRRFMLGGEAVHLIKSTLRSNEVILVSALPNYLADPLGFSVARTANDAYSSIVKKRRGRSTQVITHGCSTIPVVT